MRIIKETINNDVRTMTCQCPDCRMSHRRSKNENIFYCECGTKLHAPAMHDPNELF